MPEAHVILVTHTPERLRRTFLALASQTTPPTTITLSCDVDDDAIRDVAQSACDEFAIDLTLVQRAHAGVSRSAQVRNNAVRAVLEHHPARDSLLIFLDADCVPEPDLVRKHLDMGGVGLVVLAHRYELTEAQTESFDEDALRRGEWPARPTADQTQALAHRAKRLRRQARLRRWGMAKAHKPKLLSANFSVALADYLRVNGFDETYEGWGQEDDDLGRRLYQIGVRPVIAVDTIAAFHQYHPTRAPRAWEQGPNASRLSERAPSRCARGVENPLEQAAPRHTLLTPRAATARTG
ncbi:MAG: galactosyltransferase-related protein [Phycisphaerales bacterium]